MVRWSLAVLVVMLLVSGSVVPHASTQGGKPEIEYGAISGNAFALFNDETGSGVDVVAFGPKSGGEDYGVVFKNFTDAPVYGIDAIGDVTGDDGSFSANISIETIAPYAVPTNGLAIHTLAPMAGNGVGDNASFDPKVDYREQPPADGAPRVAMPIDEITRDGNTVTARVTNGYGFQVYGNLAELVCLDDRGAVTNSAEATTREEEYLLNPIPVAGVVHYDFELTGDDIECGYFLASAAGIDTTEARNDAGSAPIDNDPQVPSQVTRSTVADPSSGIAAPVADCTPFADYEEAQRYYADHPDEQSVIDPDLDGYACEVFFGIDPGTDAPAVIVPPVDVPTAPSLPGAGPVDSPPNTNPPTDTGPVYTGFGGLDGIDYDCYDFSTSADAQAYFEADGGSVYNNADALDRNNNGLACEPGEFD